MADPLDLSGQVTIVTGGTKGVGRGIAERLLEAGADVVVCARSEPAALPAAGERQALFCAADVRELADIEAVIACGAPFARRSATSSALGRTPSVWST